MSDEERERPQAPRRMACEVLGEHRVLHQMPDALLREIPLLEEATPLERRREYIDLHDPARADFRAEGTERVKPGQRIVARADVSDECWAELRGACDRVARRRPLRRAS